jgi:hypothetical protein
MNAEGNLMLYPQIKVNDTKAKVTATVTFAAIDVETMPSTFDVPTPIVM